MAIRSILVEGDPTLRKKTRKVEVFDAHLHTLLDDMVETMRKADGAGLAAPQVGILRRVVTIDSGEEVLELINPVIIERSSDQQLDEEGCLSVPGKWGMVFRPVSLTVRAQNRFGRTFDTEADEVLSRVVCHELDHLDGILYVDKVEYYIDPDKREEKEEQDA